MTHRDLASVACYAAAILYGFSLLLPVFYLAGEKEANGFLCLLFGWLGCWPAWFANPFLYAWLICMLTRSYRAAIFCGLVAAALATTSFFIREVLVDAVADRKITGYGLGFYLWHSSIAVCLLSSASLCYFKPEPRTAATGSN